MLDLYQGFWVDGPNDGLNRVFGDQSGDGYGLGSLNMNDEPYIPKEQKEYNYDEGYGTLGNGRGDSWIPQVLTYNVEHHYIFARKWTGCGDTLSLRWRD